MNDTFLLYDDSYDNNEVLKLTCGHWDPYDQHYIACCDENGYLQYINLMNESEQSSYRFCNDDNKDGLCSFVFKPGVQRCVLLLPFECNVVYQCLLRQDENKLPCNVAATHTDVITCFDTDIYGQFVVTGDASGCIKVWLLLDGNDNATDELHSLHTISNAHRNQVTKIHCLVDAFISGGVDQTVRLWNVPDGSCLHEFSIETMHVSSFTSWRWNDEEQLFACGTIEGTIYVWSLNTMVLRAIMYDCESEVMSLAVDPSSSKGDILASGHINGVVQWYELHNDDDDDIKLRAYRSLMGPIVNVEYSPVIERSGQLFVCMCNGRFMFNHDPPSETVEPTAVVVEEHHQQQQQEEEDDDDDNDEPVARKPPVPIPHPSMTDENNNNSNVQDNNNTNNNDDEDDAIPRKAPPKRHAKPRKPPSSSLQVKSDTTKVDTIIAEKTKSMNINELDETAQTYALPTKRSSLWFEKHVKAVEDEVFNENNVEVRKEIEKALNIVTNRQKASKALNQPFRKRYENLPNVQKMKRKADYPKVGKQVNPLWLQSMSLEPSLNSLRCKEVQISDYDKNTWAKSSLGLLKRKKTRRSFNRRLSRTSSDDSNASDISSGEYHHQQQHQQASNNFSFMSPISATTTTTTFNQWDNIYI